MAEFRRVAALKTAHDFLAYIHALGIDLPFDETVQSGPAAPLAQPIRVAGRTLSNRLAILPMEGWDAATDGQPTDLVRRRWQRFGESGAKLVWGEATAVRPDGRANPNQLMILPETVAALAEARELLVHSHETRFGRSDDLLVGLQLTHSGRFARPHGKKMEPFILYYHPILDHKFGLPPAGPLFSDDDIDRLIDDFSAAAKLAQQAGFGFVDLKHCHGYLGHEFLTAHDRPGRYGGSFENRTRFLRSLVAAVRTAAPGLEIAVRLSAFDFIPFQPGPEPERRGAPTPYTGDYRYAFGSDATGLAIDLAEPLAFLDLLTELGIELVCITAGSPYYTPHIQRPAFFPPSDGYQPPEDPLVGVARQINVLAELKRQRPQLIYVGTGYSYLQDWLPQVAQAAVRTGQTDIVGIGRMALSYPELCADLLTGAPLQRKRICRTFSDCTTGPRNGLVSGCYPLDDFYKKRPEFTTLQKIKGELP